MVSLRRRRLLGLWTGAQSPCLGPLTTVSKNENASESATHSSNSDSVHRIPLDDLNIRVEDVSDPSGEIGPIKVTDSSHSSDQHNQPKEVDSQPITELEVKRRRQHRRKRIHSQDHCDMRGCYSKNNKWQAAIKVDKKQIHLGTVSTQEEAAHLYDRAAFMCGREPNFELAEEEKQQLRKLKWDEFLAMTRSAITNKRSRKGHVTRKSPPSFQNSDWEVEQGAEGSSASEF